MVANVFTYLLIFFAGVAFLAFLSKLDLYKSILGRLSFHYFMNLSSMAQLYIYIYIYIYVCVCVCVCRKINKVIQVEGDIY